MQVEWDEAKREENLRKHGIDFVGVEMLFEGFTATIEDDRLDYGEQRFVTFGTMDGRVVAVVHTEQSDSIRIISIRKATKREEQSYFSTISE
ncbi:MAG TPA: BrnT family toxin [Thermoanaerobaculia bacterium]